MITLRAAILVAPSQLLIKWQFQFFHTTVISHSYCVHMAIIKLTLENVCINNSMDCGLHYCRIWLHIHHTYIQIYRYTSYIQIYLTVFCLLHKKARLETFNTCIAWICVFLQFYLLASSPSSHIDSVIISPVISMSHFLAFTHWSPYF